MALSYAEKGWSPVAIPIRTKRLTITGWQEIRLRTPEDVHRNFSGPKNVCVILGAASKNLTDIDLDCPEAISLAPTYLPSTGAIFGRDTARGAHWLYYLDQLGEKAAERLEDPDMPKGKTTIIELRTGGGSKGAYTVFPGSTHEETGEAITWERTGEPAQAEFDSLHAKVKLIAAGTILARCWNSGSRHDFALLVGAFLGRCPGWTVEQAEEFIEAVATAAADDEISDRIKAGRDGFEEAAKGGKARGFPSLMKAIGEKRAKKVAGWLGYRKEAEDAPKNADAILALNEKYCVVIDQVRSKVLFFRDDDVGDMHARQTASFMAFEDFIKWHRNKTIIVGDPPKPKNVAQVWLDSPLRREYEDLTFQPGGAEEINGKLNLWRGWGVEPKQGDWSLMRRHIEEVLANGDEVGADYIIRWVAWAFQNPARQAEAALVFQGQKGTGKGTLGNALTKIFGQHGVHISSADHLAGRFNAHLRDACLLFADEAYWPGNRSAEGNLKRLITEPDLQIEAKGKDAIRVRNMIHAIMASNEQWVVPAGEGERRYVVFKVPDTYMQDPAWFGPIYAEMAAGGLGAMLYDLLAFDLKGWHPRQIIKTAALRDQIIESLDAEDQWWLGILQEGSVPTAEPGFADLALLEDRIYAGLTYKGLLSDAKASSAARLSHLSSHKLGDYLRKRGCKKPGTRFRGGRLWQLPPLKKAREDWEKRFGPWEWDHPEQEEWHNPTLEERRGF